MVTSGYLGVNGFGAGASKKLYGTSPVSSVKTLGNNRISSTDSFQYSKDSLHYFYTEDYLKSALDSNPEIKRILTEKGIKPELNVQNLRHIQNNHAADTQAIAKGIIRHLPKSEQYQIDTDAIHKASYLHDIGKVFIPDEILNKPAMLDSYEYEIMKSHSELGYEILKNSSLDEKTKELVKYHHQDRLGTGYPAADIDLSNDINLQILSIADKYSALTENRSYKSAMSPEQALGIIYADVQKNKVHPAVFRGLAAHLRESRKLAPQNC
ncbi:HD domain-containing protein [bacterium]|nr:HD domain-containing protein [bacterium]